MHGRSYLNRLPERFASKLALADGPSPNGATDCLLWMGSRLPTGYGQYSRDGHPISAHREAYELAYGPIAPGLVIDHLCCRPECVNADHLEAVTQATNIRRGKGAKLTMETARDIRERFAAGERRQSIADSHGVTKGLIYLVARGERWAEDR